MKKCAAIIVIMGILIGCSSINAFMNGPIVSAICAPTPAQQATAAIMLAALDVGWSFVPVAGAVKASAVLKVIQAGGCFLVSELTEAFKVVDAANAASHAKQVKMLKVAPSALPEYAPLRNLVK